MKHTLIILLLSIIFSLGMLTSGWTSSEGLMLRGVNATDGIWNLGLIQELKYHFPPDHPGFAGIPLKGYHFLFHLLVAIVSIVTFIPAVFLYFQVFPLLISFFWGLGVFKTVVLLTKNETAAYISTFVSFFGGSLAFIYHFIGQSQLSSDSGLGIAQPYGSSLQNPAYASSVVLVVWSLYGIIQYVEKKKIRWLVVAVLFSGVSIGFKAYAGMILMGGLLIAAIIRLLFEKKIDLFIAFFIALTISFGVFYPFNADYGFLVYAPFLHIIRMIEGPLKFTSWDELFHIQSDIGNYLGMTKLFSLVFIIFTLGNLGTRIFGVIGFFSTVKSLLVSTKFYILASIGTSFIIPFFFIQPAGGAFNITQMHWYFLFFAAIFTGPGLVVILKRIKNRVVKYTVMLIFMIGTFISSYPIFFSYIDSPQISISSEKLEIASALADYGSYDDTVVQIPSVYSFEKKDIESWFWNESSVIMAALGRKRSYITNEVVPYPYEERHDRYKVFWLFDEAMQACDDIEYSRDSCEIIFDKFVNYLQTEQIALLYVPRQFTMPEHSKLNLLIQNNTATVYEVLPL